MGFEGLPEITIEDEGARPVTTGPSDPSPKIPGAKLQSPDFVRHIGSDISS